jgi:hypothetical protein
MTHTKSADENPSSNNHGQPSKWRWRCLCLDWHGCINQSAAYRRDNIAYLDNWIRGSERRILRFCWCWWSWSSATNWVGWGTRMQFTELFHLYEVEFDYDKKLERSTTRSPEQHEHALSLFTLTFTWVWAIKAVVWLVCAITINEDWL